MSKKNSQSDGFTLIEVIVTMSLLGIIAVSSARMSLPAITQFSCMQEYETAHMSLERARHLAMLSGRGTLRLSLAEDRYEIWGENVSPHEEVLLDTFERQNRMPVVFSENVVFEYIDEHGETKMVSEGAIQIGGLEMGCEKHLHLSVEGVISEGVIN